MTLDGHEDWVRRGRNRVGLWGRHAASGWGWNQKKDKHDEICWCFLGGWKVCWHQQFLFFSWLQNEIMDFARISHIHDVQRMPSPCTAEIGKDTQADVCVRVQMAVHTNDMVCIHTNTHYI